MLRDMVRSFADTELAPNAGAWDKKFCPPPLLPPRIRVVTSGFGCRIGGTSLGSALWIPSDASRNRSPPLSAARPHALQSKIQTGGNGRHEFPADAVKQMGEMGLMGVTQPTEHGGSAPCPPHPKPQRAELRRCESLRKAPLRP